MDEQIRQAFEELRAIYVEAQAKAGPVLARLQPWIRAAQRAEELGLTANSTEDEIIEAFANTLRLDDLPLRPLVPQVLKPGAPAEILEAGRQVEQLWVSIGAALGTLGGAVLGAVR